jgi:hypothetical protein
MAFLASAGFPGKESRFSAHELRAIEKLIVENSSGLLKAWNEYFGA